MKPCMKYAKFPGLWEGFPIIAHHSGHSVHLKEFTQIHRQLSHSHALERIHCFLTDFATRLTLVTGRPKAQRVCAAHIAVKACVKLYFTLFLLPGYSLLASTFATFSWMKKNFILFLVSYFHSHLWNVLSWKWWNLSLQSVCSWWPDSGKGNTEERVSSISLCGWCLVLL